MNPTETNCCRRCQSDSGTCCVSKCCTGNSYILAESNQPSSHHSPYVILTLDCVDILYMEWHHMCFFLVGHLDKLHGCCCVVCQSFTVWSMSHTLFYHFACVTVVTFCSRLFTEVINKLSICLVPLGDLYVNYTSAPLLLWKGT